MKKALYILQYMLKGTKVHHPLATPQPLPLNRGVSSTPDTYVHY